MLKSGEIIHEEEIIGPLASGSRVTVYNLRQTQSRGQTVLRVPIDDALDSSEVRRPNVECLS